MAILIPNLVAHWKLDESGGMSAADSSGNGYTGTYTNSPTLNQTGAFVASKAVTFASASSQYVDVTPTGLLQSTSSATASAWVKTTTSATQYFAFISTGASNVTPRLGLRFASGKIVCFGTAGDGESAQSVTSTTSYNDGNWHHVVGVVNYASDTITLFVDGSPVATTGAPAFTASTTSNTSPLAMRMSGAGSGTLTIDGTLDDVRIYNRALTSFEAFSLSRPENYLLGGRQALTRLPRRYASAISSFKPFILDDCE